MFRRKDEDIAQDLLGVDPEADASVQSVVPETAAVAGDYKTVTAPQSAAPHAAVPSYARPAAAIPATPVYRPASQATDPSRGRAPEYRSGAAVPAALGAADKNAAKAANRRVLTVGNDILLKGEIATCDRLVIEGAVDATLNEVHTVEIAEGGSFKGSAEIEDAEISGVFEGELTVRNRLVIYATGKVRGKITYGEIEIERGGELSGEIRTVDQAGVKFKPKGKLEAAAA